MTSLPRPSLCLNIPKTGSSFTSRFFDAADWLELRRRGGLTRLAVPNRAGIEIVRRIKRHGPAWGNLGCRSWHHHAGYSSLAPGLRRHPRICVVRDVRSWYVSYCLYYTSAMTDTLLSRAIRMLAGGEARAVPRRRDREILSRHRREFLARWRNEDACADSLEGLSAEFLVWFTRTVRLDSLMNTWVGIDRMPDWRMGLLTFRAIAILFDDPAKVFRMRAAETEGYFASGRYLRDLRCDLFLDFDRLTEQLCRVMIGTFGYTPEIVAFLKENFGRLNVSPDRRRAGVMSELDTGGWFAETIEDEAIYRNYLQPLAGLHLDRAANQAPGSLPGDRLGPMRRVGAAYGGPLEADRRDATGRRAGPCGSRPRAR